MTWSTHLRLIIPRWFQRQWTNNKRHQPREKEQHGVCKTHQGRLQNEQHHATRLPLPGLIHRHEPAADFKRIVPSRGGEAVGDDYELLRAEDDGHEGEKNAGVPQGGAGPVRGCYGGPGEGGDDGGKEDSALVGVK